jgi:hypothetical protein
LKTKKIRLASEKKHDGHYLLFETLLHSRHRINKYSINWHCKDTKGKKSNKCPGSITSDELILKFTEHDLSLPRDPVTPVSLEALSFKHKTFDAIQHNPNKPTQFLFNARV